MKLPQAGQKHVGFGTHNTSARINEILDKLVHDETLLNVGLATATVDAQVAFYTQKALEYGIKSQLNTLIDTASNSIRRPSRYTLVPRAQGIKVPLLGGAQYEIIADTTANTALVLPEYGHITPGIRLKEDKLRMLDGEVANSLIITPTVESSSSVRYYEFRSNAIRMASGTVWLEQVRSNTAIHSVVLEVVLPLDSISNTKFNNLRVIPVHGTYITHVGTSPTSSNIANFQSTSSDYYHTSKAVDLHLPAVQSEKLYIHVASAVDISNDGEYPLIVIGIQQLELYNIEYENTSTAVINIYDNQDGTVSAAALRPHVPEVYIQTRSVEYDYSEAVDTDSRTLVAVDASGFMTVSLFHSGLPSSPPPIITKIVFTTT